MRLALIVSLASCALLGVSASGARADDPAPYEPPSFWPEPTAEVEDCPVAPEPIEVPEGEPEGGGEEGEGEEEPPAEPPPAPDPILVELRHQRIEAAQVCRALADRADEQLRRQWWTVAELNRQSPFVEGINEHLANLDGAKCGSPCPVLIEGGHVNVTGLEDGPVEVLDVEPGGEGSGMSEVQVAELVSAVDASGEASKAGLWFLAAVLLVGLLAYPLYQAFIFWRRDV